MTSQEQQLIDAFLQRLAAVHSVAKDPQVDALIRQRLADQPDAQYLLVQRALLLERALDNAKQQIEQLQQTAQRGDAGGSSFLNGGLEPGFGRAPSSPGLYPTQVIAQPSTAQAPAGAPSWRDRLFGNSAPAPAMQAAPAASGPSFLGTAASAAAGVAGGMFLFNGIESLMGGHHGNNNGLFGTGSNLSSAQPAVVENITQNYYGDGGGARDAGLDTNAFIDGGSDFTDVSDAGGGFLDDDTFI